MDKDEFLREAAVLGQELRELRDRIGALMDREVGKHRSLAYRLAARCLVRLDAAWELWASTILVVTATKEADGEQDDMAG